jgi:shikimate kinase
MNKNIVLIGFMGAGKSLVSNKLASHLKREVVSTDQWIEKREGRSIAEIFRDSGEAYFRRLEKEAVQEISEQNNLVIDCGGGVFLDADNRANLKRSGIIFYLSATAEVVEKRLKSHQNRPLLNAPNRRERIDALLMERKPYYEMADHAIDTTHQTVEETAEEILKLVRSNY